LNTARNIARSHGGKVEVANSKAKIVGLPATAQTEYDTLFGACATYTYRCLALARAAIDRTELQKISKLRLKDSTDVEMTDVSREPAVRDIIREELKALRKELSSGNGNSNLAKRQAEHQLTPYRKNKKARQSSTEELQTESSWEECEEGWQETEGRKEVSIDAFLASCSKDFRPWSPEEYPMLYCSLSDSCRIKIAFSFLREWEADSLRASKPGVFKHEDVYLPTDVEYCLAVNHKYILHPSPQDHDVEQAKERLVRAVRIKWQFRNQASRKEYIPQFHVKNPFWEPQTASPAIELGLDEATEEIDHQIGRALSRIASEAPRQRNLNWTRVRQFLQDNDLIVKLTDKNLGLAVFPRQWYTEQVTKMLQDEYTYERVSPADTDLLLGKLFDKLSKWRLPKNMDTYVRQKTTTSVPHFHAIPKVHKTPWTLRPIVPSHSWVTSRLSEVIDYLCRPILAKLPWVVDSTKQVINHLSKIRTDSPDVWICTGDVVAFYTNINSKKCAEKVSAAYGYYERDSKIDARTISQMIRYVMENNLFEFQNQTWKQKGGLAMGTSCAPVLANIYAAFYERQSRIPYQKGVLLYDRYIDDIVLIFEGTKKELIDFLPKIQLGPLSITWSYSKQKKEFLDIEIMRTQDLTGYHITTRLFKKALNKHLYIPWSSAHPLHVKKAFVKAELIRFAMVSSEVGYFADSRAQFYGNLRRIGYPPQALENWFQQVSYENRPLYLSTEKAEIGEAPLMLSGQYNPVWEHINVDEVIRTARRGWSLEKELPESLKQPLIRSLSRYTSLGDLLSAWNKTILHSQMLESETVKS
jgi:hypothetical protein